MENMSLAPYTLLAGFVFIASVRGGILTRYLLRKYEYVRSEGCLQVIVSSMLVSGLIVFCLAIVEHIIAAMVSFCIFAALGGAFFFGVNPPWEE